jgi:hypothetical protein
LRQIEEQLEEVRQGHREVRTDLLVLEAHLHSDVQNRTLISEIDRIVERLRHELHKAKQVRWTLITESLGGEHEQGSSA